MPLLPVSECIDPACKAEEQQAPGGRRVPGSIWPSMLERGANSWFYSCKTRTQREKEEKEQWLSEILTRYKEQMLKDFQLARVLPYLMYDGVFSLKEYREILSQHRYPERVESFFLKLFCKGPGAFCAFCSHLEEFSPYLLTCLFLYYQGKTTACSRESNCNNSEPDICHSSGHTAECQISTQLTKNV